MVPVVWPYLAPGTSARGEAPGAVSNPQAGICTPREQACVNALREVAPYTAGLGISASHGDTGIFGPHTAGAAFGFPERRYAVTAVRAWWCLARAESDIHRTGLGPQLRRGVEQCCVTPRWHCATGFLN